MSVTMLSYGIYGGSFLLMGSFLLWGIVHLPASKFRSSFVFLGLFGLVHSLREFADLLRLLNVGSPALGPLLIGLSVAALWVSFLLLMEFAILNLTLRETKWVQALQPVALALVLTILLAATGASLEESERIGRLLLALPATALCVGAFFVIANKVEPLGNPTLLWGARSSAIAMVAYNAVVAVKNDIFGLPVILLRAASAAFLTVALALLLRGFIVQKR